MSTVVPRTERLLILVGLVVMGLGLSPYLPLPSPVLAIRAPGATPIISVTLTPARQVGLVVTLLACAVIDILVRDDRRLAEAGLARTIPLFVVPALVILGAFGFFEGLSGALAQVVGLAATALLLSLVVIAQLQTLDGAGRWFGVARLGLNALTYALAFAAFLVACTARSRALVAPPMVALTSSALALGLLYGSHVGPQRLWGSAALIGLMMAEASWALSLGPLPPFVAGFLLLVLFYGLTGILQQHFWNRLRGRVAVEFLTVAGLTLLLVVRLLG